jgi:hypothetical protein
MRLLTHSRHFAVNMIEDTVREAIRCHQNNHPKWENWAVKKLPKWEIYGYDPIKIELGTPIKTEFDD